MSVLEAPVDEFERKFNLLKGRQTEPLDAVSAEKSLKINKEFKFLKEKKKGKDSGKLSMIWKRIGRFHSEHDKFRLKDLKFCLIDELQKSDVGTLESELRKLREKKIEKEMEIKRIMNNEGVEKFRTSKIKILESEINKLLENNPEPDVEELREKKIKVIDLEVKKMLEEKRKELESEILELRNIPKEKEKIIEEIVKDRLEEGGFYTDLPEDQYEDQMAEHGVDEAISSVMEGHPGLLIRGLKCQSLSNTNNSRNSENCHA